MIGKLYHGTSMHTIDSTFRRVLGANIVRYVENRVGVKGEGMGGIPVRGYSTTPLKMRKDGAAHGMLGKPFKPPSGGKDMGNFMFFYGGYLEYRTKAGLDPAHFVLRNLGDLWADFRVLMLGSFGRPMTIGVSKKRNAQAMNAAIENDRPNLFLLDNGELSMLGQSVVGELNKLLFP